MCSMKISNEMLSCGKAKEMDMVDYLSALGFKPERISQHNYWYLSPFRDEKTASFKVNRKMNRWYDFSEGNGGNLVDFGMRYHNCSVSELLQKLSSPFSFGQQIPLQKQTASLGDESKIKIIKEDSIRSVALVRYLNKRRIPFPIAQKFCKEISYELHGKNYYAIGFKNNSGGFELRNEYFKGSSSPKDITLIDNGAKEMAVFEGFFNFLSYQAIDQKTEGQKSNFLILNSVSFFERAKPLMMGQNSVRLFLDRDMTGQNCTQKALALGSQFKDESSLYQTHKDLNDWMMHIGQSQKQGLRQKP